MSDLTELERAVVEAAVTYVQCPDQDVETYGYYRDLEIEVMRLIAARAAQGRTA